MTNDKLSTLVKIEDIQEIVQSSLKNTLEMSNSDVDLETINQETYLIGSSAVLDSLGLVSLLLDIEQEINMQFDVLIIIADERAMSQKRSPFRSVGTLSNYIHGLVLEQKS